jgi:hypothetical protein
MAMNRKPFNWSVLDRNNLYTMLYELKPSVVGRRIAIKDLQKLLAVHIKWHLPIKVTLKRDLTHEKGLVYIGGAYYSGNDVENRRHVEITFSYKDTNATIKLSDSRWDRMCKLFADTMLHEIIHIRQYRTREFKDIPGYESTAYYARDRKEQEYYGHKDEMGAFSFNIACELYDKFGDDFDAAKRYLDSNLAKRAKKSSYHKYLKTFDWNHNHTVIRSMKKKIIRNLPYAQIGKPFRTTNHLTY